MKTDFVAIRPAMRQVRSSRPTTSEIASFTAKAFCIVFTILFALLKVYEVAKHIV